MPASVLFLLLVWCFTAEAASTHLRVQRLSVRSSGAAGAATAPAVAGAPASAEKDDQEDDDDEDDDDEATAKKTDDVPVDPHQAEEERLADAVKAARLQLAANLAKQLALRTKIQRLTNEKKSDNEIDSVAKSVANETESVAMASMLGTMWKEMRMFEVPFYSQHVQEELHQLKREETALEGEVKTAEAKLNAAQKRWAEEAKKREEKEKNAKEHDDAEPEDKLAGKSETTQHEEVVKGVKTVDTHGSTDNPLSSWSVWHMPSKQRTGIYVGSLVYFVFGIMLAAIYRSVRRFQPKHFQPTAPQGTVIPNPKDFSLGLFDCFSDPKICCMGCCCPIMRWADTLSQRGLLSFWVAFLLFFVLLVLHVYTMGISTLCTVALGVYYRQKLRRSYGMTPSNSAKTMIRDIFVWFCCQCCAIIQEAREEAVRSA